jgi:hypothetical protein
VQRRFEAVLECLERWGAERGWVGPDPYEGLNSPLGRLARSFRARQAVVQLYKRVPFAPPWPLRAGPRPNAKALALALSGYATPYGRRLKGADEFLSRIPAQLAKMNLLRNGTAWGYPFNAQTRHLYYSGETPNAIATCFVVGALCDTANVTGNESALRLALAARPYLLSLLKEPTDHGPFFAYVAAGSELIHNANIVVCGTLARLDVLEPDQKAETMVRRAATTTLALQREDGLWDYGEAQNLRWADNFHTAYILEGLCHLENAFQMGSAALERGVRAWEERFFEADGWAGYDPDRRYPLEAHSCASAIDLLCKLAERDQGEGHLTLAERVAETAIRELWLPESGRFAFRRTARGLNKRQFMRWTNAPMFRALARLCSQ